MARFNFSIGAFSFLSLEGVPGVYAKQLELLALPYKDGESTRELGLHSEPFVLRSLADVASEAAAVATVNGYVGYIGNGTRALIYRSVTFTNDSVTPLYVDVLDVRRGPIVPAHKMVGGLVLATGASGVVFQADWTLRVVPA